MAIINGTPTDDNILAVAGNDTVNGLAGNDTYDMKNAGLNGSFVSLDAGQAFSSATGFDMLAGIENVSGSIGADVIIAGSGANTLSGLGGEDQFQNLGDGDVVHGGADLDTAEFNANVEDAVIATGGTPGTYTVTIGGNTVTLDGVGVLKFNDAIVRVVGDASDYTTIQSAVDDAADGDTIFILADTYTEQVTITSIDDLTIVGEDRAGPNDVTLNGQITVGGTLDGAFSVIGLNINATGNNYGVNVTANSAGTGSVSLDDVAISNAALNGFAYVRSGNGGTPTQSDTIGAVSIANSSFTQNGSAASGTGDILLFGYNGDLTVQDVNINSTTGGRAIQMRGVQDGGDTMGTGPYAPAGDLVLQDVTVSGTYNRDAVALYNIESFASSTITNVDMTGTSAAWGLFNADGVGGTLNLSGVTGTNLHATGPEGVLQGLATADNLTGTANDDVLIGRGGSDNLDGGAGGTDTALYAGTVSVYTSTYATDGNGFVTGFSTVTGEGTDTLTGVEQLRFQNNTGTAGDDTVLSLNQAVQLFDASNKLIGTFDTLKEAADAANADAGTDFTIRLAAGDVDLGGQVVISKNITVDGAGEDVTYLKADFDTAANHNDNSGALIVVNAGVTGSFSDLTIDGTGHRVAMAIRHFGTGTVDDVHFTNIKHSTYLGTGISVRGNGDVDVIDSNFTNIERIGAHFRDTNVVGKFQGNTYAGKGDAVPALDYAAEAGGGASVEFINNIVSNNNGVAGEGSISAGFQVTDYFGPGTEATFEGNTVSNSTVGVAAGLLDTDASSLTFLAGNDFSTSNNFGVTINGNVTATGTELVNGAFDWDGGPANNAPSGAGQADVLGGGSGDDTITGAGGNDQLDGGDGTDTAAYANGVDLGDITFNGTNWTVATGTTEGTDALTDIEVIDDGRTVRLVGGGGYDSIQAAVNDAADGDTIFVGTGAWNENVVINDKELTIVGVNHGVDGNDGGRAAESSIAGRVSVTGTKNVTFDGIEFRASAGTSTTGPSNPALKLQGSGDYSVLNSVFFNETAGGGSAARGISLDTTVSGAVIIDGNLFTGASTGKYGTASWSNGVWSDGTSSDLAITDNTFTYVRTGLNLDGYDDANGFGNETKVSGNTFKVAGSGISVGIPGDQTFAGVSDNTFADVDTDFNFQNVTTPIVLDLGATDNVASGGNRVVVLGGQNGDQITGSDGDDIVVANGGDDTIDGGAGNDTMIGGAGNDMYYVDHAGDVVTEATGQGSDRVFASVSYTLGAGQEIEKLTTADDGGTSAINLTGNEVANTIYGNAGNNILNGGGSADSLNGGQGNDWYFVDNAGDTIADGVGQGSLDRVFASVSYALASGAEIESFCTTNHAGTDAINLTGNQLGNTIHGNAGNNILNGGGGADSLNGGQGNDWYFVDNAGDTIADGAGQGSLDRVFASVSYALAPGAEIEIFSTTNHAGTDAINLTGNKLANTIYGNGGANRIDGGLGNDTLVGMGGADTFVFSAALGSNNVDRIADFSAGDHIALGHAIFGAAGSVGQLAASAFFAGTAAHDADDRIIYDSATGDLLYDADGTGAATAVQFATLASHPALAAEDLLVI